MRKTMIALSVVALVLSSFVPATAGDPPSNMPLSKEAKFVEVFNQCEWTFEATGISGAKKKIRQEKAMLDAKKAAVWVILTGENGLVQTADERANLKQCQEQLFADSIILNFITYSDATPRRRIEIEKGKKRKVVIEVRVSKCALSNWLVDNCGFVPPPPYPPTLMVLPNTPDGVYPTDVLKEDELAHHAAVVLEGFLAEHRYEYANPEMTADIQELVDGLQLAIGGGKKDYAYMMAQAIGSDIYITFAYKFNNKTDQGSTTENCSITLSAFETTTAKGLGSETGYSNYYAVGHAKAAMLEEALNNAMVGVLASINGYWKDAFIFGVKYKGVFTLDCEDFDEDDAEDAADYLIDCAKEVCKKVKPGVITEKTVELYMWATQDQAEDLRDLNRTIKNCFKGKFPDGKLRRKALNKQLIFSSVACAE